MKQVFVVSTHCERGLSEGLRRCSLWMALVYFVTGDSLGRLVDSSHGKALRHVRSGPASRVSMVFAKSMSVECMQVDAVRTTGEAFCMHLGLGVT